MKILIRTPNWIGDAVMSFPFISKIASHGELTLISRSSVAPVYEALNVDLEMIVEDKKHEFLKTVRDIKKNMDIAFVLTPSFSATLPVFLSGIKRIFGLYLLENRIFLKNGINAGKRVFRNKHLRDSYLELINIAGLKINSKGIDLKFDISVLDRYGLQDNKYFIISPSAAFGPAKMWGTQRYGRLSVDICNNTGMKCIICGSKRDKDIALEIQRINEKAVDMTGKTTISDLFSLFKHCCFSVTNDSGLMHISSVTGARTYAVFGSTSPQWTGPAGNSVILYSSRDCSPCYKRTCKYGHYGCFSDIKEDEVFAKIIGRS